MEVDSVRDITHQLFPFQSPILIRKGEITCRVIVDYKHELFLGMFDRTGISLEDMFAIQTIYRLVEGGVAILFENRDGAPFVHVIQKDTDAHIHCINIRGSEPVGVEEEFRMSDHQEYNKLSCLFPSPQKT
jgi:hypothetical protein